MSKCIEVDTEHAEQICIAVGFGENMIVGVFSPAINLCGGAEWIALNIIHALKEHGHRVILLSDSPINQKKFTHIFDRTVSIDQQLIFPLRFFSQTNPHNVYTDALKAIVLKTKCDVLVDTYSNAILPGADVAYIHYPLLTGVKQGLPYWRNKFFFMLYQSFLSSRKNDIANKLIFANSNYTARAVRAEFGIKPHILYPAVSSLYLKHTEEDLNNQRDNNVTTIARISEEKNLEVIPQIASLTSKDVSFTIAGILSSKKVLSRLLSLIKELNMSERVKILTNLTREQSRRLLLNSKVFLHTKEREHFGVAIVEAMSLGCIPVVHDSGGPREFVSQTFRYRSIGEAAAKVDKAVDYWSPLEAKRVSNSANLFNEDNFSKRFMNIFNLHFKDI